MVLVVGCGSSDDDTTGEQGADEAEVADTAVEPVAGCADAWTDPGDLSPEREVARCEPEAPAARPLDEAATITVAVTTTSAEYAAPLLWAVEQGEFEQENLTVEVQVVPPPEALNLLAQGRVQAWLSSPDAAFHNALDQGFDLRWVAGNYFEQPTSQSGLWIRGDSDADEALAELEGETLATVSGNGSVIAYPIDTVLSEHGLSITDVEFQTFPAADVVSAYQNGAVQGAWLLTPAWQQVDGQSGYTYVGGQPPGEPLGGLVFGADLRTERREVGEAFLRAYIRTISTFFTGDYKDDPAFVEQIAELIEVPVESLELTDELVFDWEIREGTSERMQGVWEQTGAITYEGAIPETDVVDRSIYEAVVGHDG